MPNEVAIEKENLSSIWCAKCHKFFGQCQEVAQANNLRVIEGLFSEKITLCCERRAHLFKITYSKKLSNLSCSECRKEEREEWKDQLR